ncbi:hypothetical protein ABGB14_22490 [Nonomuraea sp. B10E15]
MPVETRGSAAPAPGAEAAEELTAARPAIKKTPIHSQLVYTENLWAKAA